MDSLEHMLSNHRYREIKEQITQNPLDYRGYIELGKHLEVYNMKQAYLCYENALFYCDDENVRVQITNRLNHIKGYGGYVSKSAMVILSYNLLEDTRGCIESIRKTTPESAREIIIVDNASVDGSVEYLRQQNDVKLILNSENAGFPRGCNQGIEIAEEDADIFLLNNDTVVCANALFWLRMALYEKEMHGAAGCVTNRIFGGQQVYEDGLTNEEYHNFAIKNNVPCDNAIEYKPFIVGFALLVRRTVLEQIGYLDERYSPGNYEDNDLCMRVLERGYQILAVHNSFIIHYGSKSFGKRNDFAGILCGNKLMFDSTYGFESDGALHANHNLIQNVELSMESDILNDVLQVNCGMGADILHMKYKYPHINFYGLDNRTFAARFGLVWKNVHVCVYNDINLNNVNKQFDLIFMRMNAKAPVSFETYLDSLLAMLKPNGKICLQVENISFYSRWVPIVLEGRIPFESKNDYYQINDIEKIIESRDCYIAKWIFNTIDPNQISANREIIMKIAEALPEEKRKNIWVDTFGLLIRRK